MASDASGFLVYVLLIVALFVALGILIYTNYIGNTLTEIGGKAGAAINNLNKTRGVAEGVQTDINSTITEINNKLEAVENIGGAVVAEVTGAICGDFCSTYVDNLTNFAKFNLAGKAEMCGICSCGIPLIPSIRETSCPQVCAAKPPSLQCRPFSNASQRS